MSGKYLGIEIRREEFVQHCLGVSIAIDESRDVRLRFELKINRALPLKQSVAKRYKGFHEELVQVEEANVMRTQDAGDERRDIGLPNNFLLLWLEHLDRYCINEWGLPAIDFARLIEEVLERHKRLAVFGLIALHDLLDLREVGFGYGVDQLARLQCVSILTSES